MPCFNPIPAWHCAKGIFFKPTIDSTEIKLPCGRCQGCRLERSRQWATRLMHELQFHDKASFITLTYEDKHLPKGGTLVVKHFQDFMKRLRDELSPKKIRFFHAGEYGEKRGRPHYHAIIFGHDFRCTQCTQFTIGTNLEVITEEHACSDYKKQTSARGDKTWRNPLLDKLWTLGEPRVGAVEFESCAYVARYICKKQLGKGAEEHYKRILPSGETIQLQPEYATMSRRPGIGYLHFKKYKTDIYPHDSVVSRGHSTKPPKYYDKQLEKEFRTDYLSLKEAREYALAISSKADKTPDRLQVREKCLLAKLGQLKRSYESS